MESFVASTEFLDGPDQRGRIILRQARDRFLVQELPALFSHTLAAATFPALPLNEGLRQRFLFMRTKRLSARFISRLAGGWRRRCSPSPNKT